MALDGSTLTLPAPAAAPATPAAAATPVASATPVAPAAAAAAAGAVAAEPLLAVALPTPAGELAVLLTPEGVVRAAGFAPVAAMVARLPLALSTRGHELLPADALAGRGAGPAAVADAVARYADGDVAALDGVPVEQPGGPFQQRAWLAMRAIAPGGTVTYAELALAAGSPTAVRAAGSACARNLVAPFVPCHRVLRSGGALGGYYYGLDVKRALLAHESRA
ncbi:methylated-DNA--[protein]-cysteine S-methyltransferase [Cellulomonas hominis]|uniref:methylated-DNA--[protein]-cysteine S-methyltransferase n=1 Tax=Cellulomonas hominis TaxID=156981 RepID=UPI0020C018AB|nr:methylated-DNA--[protein]-cysteine S-methyltransferase [Cellulomonas hominis]